MPPRGQKNNRKNNHHVRGNRGGHGPHRGRGRGGPRDEIPAPTTILVAQPQPRFRYAHTNAETDVVIQQWPDQAYASGNGYGNGNGNNRKRGTWWGGALNSRSGSGTPSRAAEAPQRGYMAPRRGGGMYRGRGRGRGRGAGSSGVVLSGDDFVGSSASRPRSHPGVGRGKASSAGSFSIGRRLGKDAPLSGLLYAERPLLRPVQFVRPTLSSSYLFQQPEDVLEPVSQAADADTTEESHVPTASRVAKLFHHHASDSDSESDDDDELEEVDFADLAQVRAEVDAIAHGQETGAKKKKNQEAEARRDWEDIEEIDFADLASVRAKVDAMIPLGSAAPRDADIIPKETFTGVYNYVEEATEAASSMNVDIITDNQPDDTQKISSGSGPTADEASNFRLLIHESHTQDLDTIPAEEGTSPLADVPPNANVAHARSEPLSTTTDSPLFFVDTQPTRPFTTRSASDVILIDRVGHGNTLGDQYDDEERIVYVAPHPRPGRASPVPAIPPAKPSRTSMLSGTPITAGEDQGEYKREVEPDVEPDHDAARTGLEEGDGPTVSTSSALAARSSRKTEVRPRRQKQRRWPKKQSRSRLGVLGAMPSKARLRDADMKDRRHPLWASRRKGDSDLDWGTDDNEEQEQERSANEADGAEEAVDDDGMDVVSNGLGGMTIDPDLDLDVNGMQGFLKSMSVEGSRFVTMDDLEDEARMRQEDEEGQGGPEGSSDSDAGNDDDHEDDDEEEEEEDEEEEDEEEEEVFNAEEAMLIAESEDDDELSDDSDDDMSPRASFQARLRKVREYGGGQPFRSVQDQSGDEEDASEPEMLPGTRAAEDESFIARTNKLLEENSHILSYRDRKQKKEKEAADFVDDPEFTTPVSEKNKKKKKGDFGEAYFAADLKAQWARDREKKVERRKEREEERLRAALDPLYQGGQGGKKAMRAAARLDPDKARAIAPRTLLGVNANTKEGVAAIESYVRAFAFGGGAGAQWKSKGKDKDKGKEKGKASESMAFPPMEKEARKVVHALAQAFGLKSTSKGSGKRRYTMLIRTTRSGVGVNEQRVRGVVKRFTGGGGGGGGKGGRGGGGGGGPRHREGEEVGKEAPKIGEGNVGFKMLASMGWTEGERIGSTASVGIDDPLIAKIKHTKLGLGAMR